MTSSLASAIASDLRDKTYDILTKEFSNLDHFDRTQTSGSYDVVVYDYRDNSALASLSAAESSVIKGAITEITIPASWLEDGTTATIESPIHIMHGALNSNWSYIDLPEISVTSLGLADYNVASYKEKEVYSDEYAAKIADWEVNGRHVTTQTKTVTEDVYSYKTTRELVSPEYYDANGEHHAAKYKMTTNKILTGTNTYTTTYPDVTYDPKPAASQGDITIVEEYDPSSLTLLDDAITKVSMIRARLGATQNALEHSYRNNTNTSENTSAAESLLRDTDMAKEMVSYSNNSIVEQAAQAMLTQANQMNEGLLRLLQV